MAKPIFIRNLREDDLPAIVDIEDRTTGISRREYWQKRIEMSEAIRPHWTSLIAEVDNRVAGFVFGRAGEMEFGLPGTIAWIEIIGVNPAYRKLGIGAKLMEQFASSAEDHGIQTIFTLLGPGHPDMERFFTKLGFAPGQMTHYQKKLKG